MHINQDAFCIFKINTQGETGTFNYDEYNKLSQNENECVWTIFRIWNKLGLNKTNIKNPYYSNKFQRFLKKYANMSDSKYIIVKQDEEQ